MKDFDRWAVLTRLKNGSSRPKIPSYTFRGQDTRIPSKMDTVGVAGKKETPVYTGDAMIGVATLHKSNAVPVFSKEDAADISKMRRG